MVIVPSYLGIIMHQDRDPLANQYNGNDSARVNFVFFSNEVHFEKNIPIGSMGLVYSPTSIP